MRLKKKDEFFMRSAIRLARKGEGLTSPNPIVGAVIVKAGRVIGKGYHRRAGGPHAEINAIRSAGRGVKGATLYVTLEPCSTFGKTPPCTDDIIKSGIKKVVIGSVDPNPFHSGRGIKILRKRGIKVVTGVLKEEVTELNLQFNKFIMTKLPYVTVKAAVTLDGKMTSATGDSKWITNEESRRYVHAMRAKNDAILVGLNTLIKDDPSLNVRYGIKNPRPPVKIVLDEAGKSPLSAKLFESPAGTVVAVTKNAPLTSKKMLLLKGARILEVNDKDGLVDVHDLLRKIAALGIISVMVEGGSKTITSLFEAKLVDKVSIFIAPKIIGGEAAPAFFGGGGIAKMKDAVALKNLSVKRFGDDILIEGYPKF